MPSTPFLLIVYIAGYLFLKFNFPVLNFKISRLNSLSQYLTMAGLSIIPLSIASLLYLVVCHYNVQSWMLVVLPFLRDIVAQSQTASVHLINLALLTMAVGAIPYRKCWWWVRYGLAFRDKKRKQLRRNLIRKVLNDLSVVSPFGEMVFRSEIMALPICITMSDDKVYVGYVLDFNAYEKTEEIEMMPLLSGYREAVTRNIVFTTEYNEVRKSLAESKGELNEELVSNAEVFNKVIPYNEIKVTNLIDLSLFSSHFASKSGTRKSPLKLKKR